MTAAGFPPRDPSDQPRRLAPDYRSTWAHSPRRAPLTLEAGPAELAAPVFGQADLDPLDADLTVNHARAVGAEGSAIGERIIVHGLVCDAGGRPIPNTLIEIWQANAGGRYRHKKDGYLAPLDPAFGGCGRCLTGPDGAYAFRTIKPGAYPWPNRGCEWRPAHIHLSLFGAAMIQRLVTQLYFEGDPLIPRCPIAHSLADPAAVDRLTARLDFAEQRPFDGLAYRFDIVLRGPRATFFETRPEG